MAELDQEQSALYEFDVFTSQFRQQVIHFCGWAEVIVPQFMASAAGADRQKMKGAADQDQVEKEY